MVASHNPDEALSHGEVLVNENCLHILENSDNLEDAYIDVENLLDGYDGDSFDYGNAAMEDFVEEYDYESEEAC